MAKKKNKQDPLSAVEYIKNKTEIFIICAWLFCVYCIVYVYQARKKQDTQQNEYENYVFIYTPSVISLFSFALFIILFCCVEKTMISICCRNNNSRHTQHMHRSSDQTHLLHTIITWELWICTEQSVPRRILSEKLFYHTGTSGRLCFSLVKNPRRLCVVLSVFGREEEKKYNWNTKKKAGCR